MCVSVCLLLLTGGVDQMAEDSQRARPAPLIAVLQLLKYKHHQLVREGVR